MASKPVLLETMATSASMFLPLANVIVSTFAATAILAFELAEAKNTSSFSAAETIAVVFVSSDGSIGGLGLNDIRGKSIQQKCKLRDYVLHVSFGSQLPRHSHGKVGNTMTIIVKQCCGSVIPGPNSRKDKKPVKKPVSLISLVITWALLPNFPSESQEECCVQDILPWLGDTGVSEISILLIHNILVQLVRNRST